MCIFVGYISTEEVQISEKELKRINVTTVKLGRQARENVSNIRKKKTLTANMCHGESDSVGLESYTQ